ncbi:Hypothetical predicted protein [Octopus vulgaris]|uniref:Uncharacterized protein n=1 Tax=Octopus vulgaris TaxID=6645 RepID=A0AA36ANB4_OCTVU|nr:Hypothetical predicted protein [Octopus vulgaris]
MLNVAFKGDGVKITQLDGDLFNVAQYKAQVRTTNILVRGILLADDSSLVACYAEDMRKLVYNFAKAEQQFIRKTEYHYQTLENLPNLEIEENIAVRHQEKAQCRAAQS